MLVAALPMMSVPQPSDGIVLADWQELAAVWRNEAFVSSGGRSMLLLKEKVCSRAGTQK